jgi:BirA family biotin operon repressor/biotin-[acetyl-CoA-carboxylase] ligase
MTELEIKKYLTTKIFGNKIHCFDSIDSTNTYAKTLASQGSGEGTIVIAEEQTAGRGRFDREWLSTPGENLTFSVLLRPKISPLNIGVLSLYAGVSVTQALKGFLNITPSCKWPNDVLLDGKKCCGILCEGMFSNNNLSAVIVGVGLNVNQRRFPSALAPTATSLALARGQIFDRVDILARVLEKLERLYSYIQEGNLDMIIQQWREHTTMMGKEIAVEQAGERLNGIAKAIDTDGGLIIAMNGTDKKVFTGDVTILH